MARPKQRRLVLMRHAKSSWMSLDVKDHDRTLDERGRLAASLMGAWLELREWRLDHVMLSSARRALDTWARMEPMLSAPPAATIVDHLYLAEPHEMLEIGRQTPARAETALLVGHNPGIQDFANMLVGEEAISRVSTAGVIVLRVSAGPWSRLKPGGAMLERYERPKSLV